MIDGTTKERVEAISVLFAGLARPVSDAQVVAMVRATRSVPMRWLMAAVDRLTLSWDSEQWPGARDIVQAAAREAGFRPRYLPSSRSSTDGKPLLPAWWPESKPVPLGLAETWDAPPAEHVLASGQRVLLPERAS